MYLWGLSLRVGLLDQGTCAYIILFDMAKSLLQGLFYFASYQQYEARLFNRECCQTFGFCYSDTWEMVSQGNCSSFALSNSLIFFSLSLEFCCFMKVFLGVTIFKNVFCLCFIEISEFESCSLLPILEYTWPPISPWILCCHYFIYFFLLERIKCFWLFYSTHIA